MKSVFVFVLFAIIAVAHADEDLWKEKISASSKECAEKTNFSEEGIKKLHAKDLTETENVRCFQKCFFESIGVVNDNGLDDEVILSLTKAVKKDEAKTKEKLVECAPLYKADSFDCDAAWEIYKCFNTKE